MSNVKCKWCSEPATIRDYREIDNITSKIPSCNKCYNLSTEHLLLEARKATELKEPIDKNKK